VPNTLTIAQEPSTEARVVVEAVAPYRIVFVNKVRARHLMSNYKLLTYQLIVNRSHGAIFSAIDQLN
jgi:hypothetical protein